MSRILRAAMWVALGDALLFVGALALLDASSTPAFGPPQALAATAAAYERLHQPLKALVPQVQALAGCQGNLLQSWRTPKAQALRMALFVLNSFGAAYLFFWLFWGAGPAGGRSAPQLARRLREWAFSKRPWSGPSALSPDAKKALQKDLGALQDRLAASDPDWQGLLQARAKALAWTADAAAEPELWRALGEATLVLGLKGGLAPQAEAEAMGKACLRQALLWAPQSAQVLGQALAWDALEPAAAEEAAKALAALAPKHPEPLRWRLRRDLRNGSPIQLAPPEEAALRANPEGLALLAGILQAQGEPAAALDPWCAAVRQMPKDLRWQEGAKACAAGLDEEARKRCDRLPAFGAPPAAAADWVFALPQAWASQSRRMLLRRSLAGLLLAAGLGAGLWVVVRSRPPQLSWPGRWVCDALINPVGERLPTDSLPETYPTPLSEEACGYNAACELIRTLAFILEPGGRGEIRLGQDLHKLSWSQSMGGVEMILDDSAEHPRLRMMPDGVELALEAQTWHFLFKREQNSTVEMVRSSGGAAPGDAVAGKMMRRVDMGHGVTLLVQGHLGGGRAQGEAVVSLPFLNRWQGPNAKLVQTRGGTFMDLGERGFVLVAAAGMEPSVFEGLREEEQQHNLVLGAPPGEAADLIVADGEGDAERGRIVASWSGAYTAQTSYQPPPGTPSQCGRCSRRSDCYTVRDVQRR